MLHMLHKIYTDSADSRKVMNGFNNLIYSYKNQAHWINQRLFCKACKSYNEQHYIVK